MNTPFEKFLKFPGEIFGLSSVILGGFLIYLSYLQFPGYNMLNNNISLLGIGPGLAPLFFALSLILISIFSILFFIFLSMILKQQEDHKLRILAILTSLISCISLFLIAFFPVINNTMGIIHAYLALLFFYCGCLSLIFFSILMLEDNIFSKIHAYIGFCVAGLIIFYLIVKWPIVEWSVFFAIGAWTIQISIYLLYKRFRS